MSLVFRRCLKPNSSLVLLGNTSQNILPKSTKRSISDDKTINETQLSCSTIFIEKGLNVHELPLLIRKLKDISEVNDIQIAETPKRPNESPNYHLIQEEFKQCMDLRDVFTLLNKCTKITPNIALGAMERIYDLEKNPTSISIATKSLTTNMAKGAILDKLLRVIMKTEDTQTILNILNTESSFMELYKPKFSDEILLRVIDGQVSIEQLCEYMEFLIKNKSNSIYFENIDKLWVGFLENDQHINEKNICKIYQILHGFKLSKRTILALLENKLLDLWSKIGIEAMLSILETLVHEKYVSAQSFAVIGSWLYANIHAIDQDSLLDVISKLTHLNYTDQQVENAVKKYMKLKGPKIISPVLIVGVLNYCQHFHLRNDTILNACSEYFIKNSLEVPNNFMKSIIYPFGYLNFDPAKSEAFWTTVESVLDEQYNKFNLDDICSILLSFIYVERYPLKLINRLFGSEQLMKIRSPEIVKKLHLIDTALTLECSAYHGPLLPKDHWTIDVPQDPRIKNLLKKTKEIFLDVAGGENMMSTAVLIPHIYSDETYLIDILLHPTGPVNDWTGYNWKSKSVRNENTAVLIHLPDHYCSDNKRLLGHQEMRKKQLKILGLKVVTLNYSILSHYYTSCNISALKEYLEESINNAEKCT